MWSTHSIFVIVGLVCYSDCKPHAIFDTPSSPTQPIDSRIFSNMAESVGLVGDSYVSRFPDDLLQGWHKITRRGDWKTARDFFEKDMVNMIIGDSTRPKAAWVVISLGGNDIPYQTDDQIVQDLYSIAAGFKNKGLTPFIWEINSITKPWRQMTPEEYKTRTKNINTALKDTFAAKAWEYDVVIKIPVIEIGEDGVHPTYKGFQELKRATAKHIEAYKKNIIS